MQLLFLIYKIMIEYLLNYLLILFSILSTIIVVQLFFIGYIEIKDYFKNS